MDPRLPRIDLTPKSTVTEFREKLQKHALREFIALNKLGLSLAICGGQLTYYVATFDDGSECILVREEADELISLWTGKQSDIR